MSSSARSRPPTTELDDVHSSMIEIVEEALASHREQGLTEAEAQTRLAQPDARAEAGRTIGACRPDGHGRSDRSPSLRCAKSRLWMGSSAIGHVEDEAFRRLR